MEPDRPRGGPSGTHDAYAGPNTSPDRGNRIANRIIQWYRQYLHEHPDFGVEYTFFFGGDPKKKVYSTQNHDISAPETCDRPAGRIQSSELVLQMLPVSSNLVGSAHVSLGAKDLEFLS